MSHEWRCGDYLQFDFDSSLSISLLFRIVSLDDGSVVIANARDGAEEYFPFRDLNEHAIFKTPEEAVQILMES